jgi:predicted metal-binding membrane protein
MALLFVGGAMNNLWIAALTVLLAIEKVAPKGTTIAKALGAVMIGAGVVRLALGSSWGWIPVTVNAIPN